MVVGPCGHKVYVLGRGTRVAMDADLAWARRNECVRCWSIRWRVRQALRGESHAFPGYTATLENPQYERFIREERAKVDEAG